jgi:signal transduction histidine kinase
VSGRLDGRRWVATISDDGPGIPVADVNRVFEPFYRLTREEHCRAEGIGLGLAVTRELVGQLGGKIGIHSGVGQGTCVTVEFPVDASELASAAKRR